MSNEESGSNAGKGYECPKCHHDEFIQGVIRTTGDGLSRFLDIQNQKFSHITCGECGYTEFFKRGVSTSDSLLDLFLGG